MAASISGLMVSYCACRSTRGILDMEIPEERLEIRDWDIGALGHWVIVAFGFLISRNETGYYLWLCGGRTVAACDYDGENDKGDDGERDDSDTGKEDEC